MWGVFCLRKSSGKASEALCRLTSCTNLAKCHCEPIAPSSHRYVRREWKNCRIWNVSKSFHGRKLSGIPRTLATARKTLGSRTSGSHLPKSLCPDIPSRASDGARHCAFAEAHAFIASAADARLLLLIWACSKNKDLPGGTRLHAELQKRGLAGRNYSDALITMYAKCGKLHKAQTLLDMYNSSRIVPWTALIEGYARRGQGQNAFNCFERMQHKGIPPDAVTYTSVLKACAAIRAIDKGKQIHDEISRLGFLQHDIVLGGALVDMYVKCEALPQAKSVLESLSSRNVILWSALIAGYAEKRLGKEALECYEQMLRDGIPPNAVTYACVLKACAVIADGAKGKKIHDEISRQGLLEHDVVLSGALVDMYAKCGALPQAQSILEKLPSATAILWSALIAGYAKKGQGQEALECFKIMQQRGISPDAVTYVCILKACAAIGDINNGKQIHEEISREGLLEHNVVLGGALVDLYAKCGTLPQAQSVLEKLPCRNAVLWSALISGYTEMGQGQQALECFDQMLGEGISPDAVTYLCILKVCARIGAMDTGKKIHEKVLREGLLEHDLVLGNALVDMYAKCGDLHQARSVLVKLPSRDVVSWNSLLAGYAQKGKGEQALQSIDQMHCEGIRLDVVSFLCLLNLCSHLGLVEKGQELFDSMVAMHNCKPDIDCFTCMVDFLGRAGHLTKAVEVIQKMPCSANSAIWLCLLGGCRKWADVNIGAWAFQQAIGLDKCIGPAC